MRWIPRIDRPRRVLEEQSVVVPDGPELEGTEQHSSEQDGPGLESPTGDAAAALQLAFSLLGTDGRFIAVGCSIPAWLSFYASAAARDADAQRPITADPSPSAGVLLDLHFNAQTSWLLLPPGATYSNADTPLQARIWATLRPDAHGQDSPAATVSVLALVEHELALAPAAPPALLPTA